MKNHVIVLTIDLDAIAAFAMAVLRYASLPFLWLYYTTSNLVEDIIFYAPYAWKALKKRSKVIKRYAVIAKRYAKVIICHACDMLLYAGMFAVFLVMFAVFLVISFCRGARAWLSDAWAFRAAVLAEC